MELKALNEKDALARRAKLAYARLDGELVAKVPQAVGWTARLLVMLKNVLGSR